MKKSDLASYFLFALTAFAGGTLGLYHGDSNTQDFSSEAPQDIPSVNDYKVLQCPDDAKYAEYLSKLHLELPKDAKGCNTKITEGLGKILLLMDKTRINAPENWLPVIRKEFNQPLEYLASHVDKMYFNLAETDALATNMGGREIVLGGGLLMNDPFQSMSTLIHESRHSEKQAVVHVECNSGDLPRTRGGCDADFAVDEHAGAYSYDVLFQTALGLFGADLGTADREYLLSSALSILATRFNNLPAALSAHSDLLVTLDKQNQVAILHPFTQDILPLNIKFKTPDEHVERIEFAVRNSGVMLFTNKKHLFTWSLRGGMGPLYKNMFHNDIAVSEAARISLPNEQGRSRFVAQDIHGKMYWVKFNPKILDFSMAPFPYLESNPAKILHTVWKRFFLSMYGETVYLSHDGKVYIGGHSTEASSTFNLREDLQDPAGWVSGTGGLVYEQLYLVNKAGEVKLASVSLEEIDDYHSISKYKFENIDFQIPDRSVKYLQGLQTQAQLNQVGDLYLRGYKTDKVNAIKGHQFKDFAFSQLATLDQSISPTSDRDQSFEQVCHIKKRIHDPWFERGIGIDDQQRLVFSGPANKPCLIRAGLPAVNDVSLKADSSGNSVGLQLETSAGPIWLGAYSY